MAVLPTIPRTPSRSVSVICESSSPDTSTITRAGAQLVANVRSALASDTREFDRSTTTTSDRRAWARAASTHLVAEPKTRKSDSAANSRRKPSRLMTRSLRRKIRVRA